MEGVRVDVKKAFEFLKSDVGSEAVKAFHDLLHGFQNNIDSMISTWPELAILFEVGFFVRGPSVFAGNPDDSDDGMSFLQEIVISEDPRKFAIRIMEDIAKEHYANEEEDDE